MSDLINLTDAARKLGVSRSWLRRLVQEGRVPAIPVGVRAGGSGPAAYLFRPEDLATAAAVLRNMPRPGAPRKRRSLP